MPRSAGLLLEDAHQVRYLCKVEDGRFEVRLPGPGLYEPVEAISDDGARWTRETCITVAADGRVEVVLSDPSVRAIRVVDGETREPIRGVAVVPVPDPRHGLAAPELPRDYTDENGIVRVAMASDHVPRYLWAPGYAARRLSMMRSAPHSMTLPMWPGGAIRLQLDGWAAVAKPRVTVRRRDGGDCYFPDGTVPAPDADGQLLVPGLRPGVYDVRVGPDRNWWTSDEYGSAVVTVKPRSESQAAILLASPVDLPLVRCAGTLRSGGDWETSRLHLLVTGGPVPSPFRVDLGTLDVRQGASVPFDAGLLYPGDYELVVEPFGYAVPFTLTAAHTPLDLQAPAPVKRTVRVVDDVTGAAIDAASVWALRRGTGRYLPALQARGQFLLGASAGEVNLAVQAAGYVFAKSRVDVTAHSDAAPTHIVRLTPHGTVNVLLVLADGSSPARVPEVWMETPKRLMRCFFREGAFTESIPPGSCTVSLDGLTSHGYRSVAPQDVIVRPGETTRVTFTLEPR